MASTRDDVLQLHCGVGGVARDTSEADTGQDLDTILEQATEKLFTHITGLTANCPRTTAAPSSTSAATSNSSGTSTTTSTPSTTNVCHPHMDVVFVIDESTSIIDDRLCDDHTPVTFINITRFAVEVVKRMALAIEKSHVRVGVVVFATGSYPSVWIGVDGNAGDIAERFLT